MDSVQSLVNEANKYFLQRSRLSIVASILENCYESSRKTRLIQKCNLNLFQFNKYVDFLTKNGLLKKNVERGSKNKFVISYLSTDKGREFVKDYKNISKILDEITV